MPRPRKFDTDLAIDQITELFWANGFGAVSIQDIAKTTSLRPGSLHSAFGNKDDMFELAYERYGSNFREHLQNETTGIKGAEAYLKLLAKSALEDPDRKGCFIVNTAGELGKHTEQIKQQTRERLDEMKSFFLERLNEDGITSDRSCNALFGAAVAILTLARAHEPAETLEDIIDSVISNLPMEKTS